jgi:hypothetical protein
MNAVGMLRNASYVALALCLFACAGNKPKVDDAPGSPADAGAPQADAAPAASAEPPKPVERPVANTREEVLMYIDQAVDAKNADIKACVDAYRKRVNDPGAKLHVQIGIDQEGTLMGVAVKKKAGDDEAALCVKTAMRSAVFPRSKKAGVITVDKVFEFIAVYPK